MQNLGLILLVFAFVFAFIAALFTVSPPNSSRVNFGWLAIACWIAAELIGGASRVFH